jgi:hypothetical protein
MELELTIAVSILIFFYVFSRFWSGIRLGWKLRRQWKYELNDILTNDRYKVKGRNE